MDINQRAAERLGLGDFYLFLVRLLYRKLWTNVSDTGLRRFLVSIISPLVRFLAIHRVHIHSI